MWEEHIEAKSLTWIMNRQILRQQAVFLYVSLLAGLLLVVATGLVTDFGEWYSKDLGYRRQTEAFLRGQIALADTPAAMLHDYCWINGKMQQVWGLGIPVWRLLFEVPARILGQKAFPDRLAFAFAYTLAAFLVLKAIWAWTETTNVSASSRWPMRLGASLILLAFPSLITVCRTRFLVYEEAAAYTYLYGISLFSGLVLVERKRSLMGYLVLALLSGLAPLLRPTLVFYGGATFVLSTWVAWKAGWSRSRIATALALFVAGLSLLFATNWQRFGSPMEFGHSLNFSDLRICYATHLENPYRKEPVGAATRELLGALFQVKKFNEYRWYENNLFTGQSSSPRWREFYFSTYDVSFATLLAVAFASGVWCLRRTRWKNAEVSLPDSGIVWTALTILPLFVFYLHTPFLTSRYLLDFGPAVAVALVALWMRSANRLAALPQSTLLLWMAGGALFIWIGAEIITAKIEPLHIKRLATTRRDALNRLHSGISELQPLPGSYALGESLKKYGFPENGKGWEESGRTEPMVTFYVNDPMEIVVEVTPEGEGEVAEDYYAGVRVKIQSEELQRKSVERIESGRRITFFAPRTAENRQGVQALFLAMMPPGCLGHQEYSSLRLLRIRWREI